VIGRFFEADILPSKLTVHWLWINFYMSLVLFIAQGIYVLSGLLMVKAPMQIYFRLLYMPVYLGWKIGQYIRVLTGREQKEWVRTTRNEG
jgi:hypothetical protein